MAGYPAPVVDEIRRAVDLVELVGRFVTLRKAGVNWKGLCPFHAEKTPSFMVNPAKGIFHCFGCGVGGDAFGFLMRQDRLSFPEAVRALARATGVALPADRGRDATDSGREELFRVMELAARFYAEALWRPGGERGRAYLEQRGIDPELGRRFGLGLAPDGWDRLLGFMRAERVSEDLLVTAGLAVAREERSGVYDRFRGRLLFAIRDVQGRVVAFGGRALGDEQPKYLNSPETPLYTKGQLLYAIDQARDRMRTRNRALLVEGYVDCLMAHQHGFAETVAALGTAFTASQLALLRRYCDEVVTFFDADEAGRKAAERAEELLEPTDGATRWAVNRSGDFDTPGAVRIKVALLPPGHDPDTFLRAEGAERFAERIGQARSLLAYGLDRVVAEAAGPAGSRARLNAFARVALMLAKVPDGQEAAALSHEAARKLGVDPTQLWTESRRLQGALRKPAGPVGAGTAAPAVPPVERDLVQLLLGSDDARRALLPTLEEADVVHPHVRAIVAALRAHPEAAPPALLTHLEDAEARSLLAALTIDEPVERPEASAIQQFGRRLHRARQRRRLREFGEEFARDAPATATLPEEQVVAFLEASAGVYQLAGGVPQKLERRAGAAPGPEGPPRSPHE